MGEPAIRLGLMGRDAARCLRALGRDGGSVLAVFRRSVYLEHGASGAIACVGPPALGAGPLNALAGADAALPDWQDSGLAPGDPVTPRGDGIGIAGLRALTFRDARPHDPPRGPHAWTGDGLDGALARLSAMLAPFALADGLAPLADPARRAAPPASPVDRTGASGHRRARILARIRHPAAARGGRAAGRARTRAHPLGR